VIGEVAVPCAPGLPNWIERGEPAVGWIKGSEEEAGPPKRNGVAEVGEAAPAPKINDEEGRRAGAVVDILEVSGAGVMEVPNEKAAVVDGATLKLKAVCEGEETVEVAVFPIVKGDIGFSFKTKGARW